MTHFPKANYYDILVLDLHINEKTCVFSSPTEVVSIYLMLFTYHVICTGGFLMAEWQILVVQSRKYK